jgi:hypothetical protein
VIVADGKSGHKTNLEISQVRPYIDETTEEANFKADYQASYARADSVPDIEVKMVNGERYCSKQIPKADVGDVMYAVLHDGQDYQIDAVLGEDFVDIESVLNTQVDDQRADSSASFARSRKAELDGETNLSVLAVRT